MNALLFDLDNTLYPRALGVVDRIDRRINEYLRTRIGVSESEVDALRRRFWADHGTTLAGLMSRHRVDPDEYLEYVHDVDLSDVVKPDPLLRGLLARLPGRKAVFTNASRAHAERVIRLLDLDGCFEVVMALEDRAYVPKPLAESYRAALGRVGETPGGCAFIDDTRANLPPARRLGMRTLWLTDESAPRPEEGVDHVIGALHEIEPILRGA